MMAARNVQRLVAPVGEVGEGCGGVSSDCTTRDGIDLAVEASGTPPDIAIFNIVRDPRAPFWKWMTKPFQVAHINNVMAFRSLVQAVYPDMQAHGWRRILTIGTNSVKQPHRKLPRAAQNTYRFSALALSKLCLPNSVPSASPRTRLAPGALPPPNFAGCSRKSPRPKGAPTKILAPNRVHNGRSVAWATLRTWPLPLLCCAVILPTSSPNRFC